MNGLNTEAGMEQQVPVNFKSPHKRGPRFRYLTSSSDISDGSRSDDSSSSSSDASSEYGLLISITDDGICQLKFLEDTNLDQIHVNVYAPKALEDVKVLGGGGSGVAVFSGHHPEVGDLVMKHGGVKDLEDLFALASIAQELKKRGLDTDSPEQKEAAEEMQSRIPEFKAIYISPHHFRSRGEDLWKRLRGVMKSWALLSSTSLEKLSRHQGHGESSDDDDAAIPKEIQGDNINLFHDVHKFGKSLRLYEGDEDCFSFQLDTNKESFALVLPKHSSDFQSDRKVVDLKGDAFTNLKSIVDALLPIAHDKLFKFTLAQKTIGGMNPRTGNQVLYSGELNGSLLDNLVSQIIHVIHNLRTLTKPEEADIVDFIRAEVERFENGDVHNSADSLSQVSDDFVGNAIKKNFDPVKGRSKLLRELGAQFRNPVDLYLTDDEMCPAKHLGDVLRAGALMSDTFCDCPMEPTVLQPHTHFWRNILRRAVDERSSMSQAALTRIWNCGLADAGIHNLFLSETDLWMFDLGEPALQSIPGFLTKFLFSFFHTLGMEEREDKEWVIRFRLLGDKLALTPETADLLPKAYDAFEVALDRIIDEVFDGDNSLRWLLIQYVTLQLMSDTAFCLGKWQVKGGGRSRSANHNKDITKWLWRALWDVYVAYDINTQDSWYRLGVEHPLHRESTRLPKDFNLSDLNLPTDLDM